MLTLTYALVLSAGLQNPVLVENIQDGEAGMTASLAEHVRKRSHAFECPEAVEYLHRLEQRLAAPGASYTFELITDSTNELQEPIALAGGYIFVPAGLFMAARDEAEFAGMLAHAMAHVEVPRGMRTEMKAGGSAVPQTFVYMPGPTAMVPMRFLEQVRAFEAEADVAAVRKLDAAGYDPGALARYIERRQRDDGGGPNKLSSLPPRATRVAALQEFIGTLPARTYTTGSELERVKEEVRSRMPVRVFPDPDNPPRLRRP